MTATFTGNALSVEEARDNRRSALIAVTVFGSVWGITAVKTALADDYSECLPCLKYCIPSTLRIADTPKTVAIAFALGIGTGLFGRSLVDLANPVVKKIFKTILTDPAP